MTICVVGWVYLLNFKNPRFEPVDMFYLILIVVQCRVNVELGLVSGSFGGRHYINIALAGAWRIQNLVGRVAAFMGVDRGCAAGLENLEFDVPPALHTDGMIIRKT